mgnify:CR=1 FL=1
MSRNVWEMLKSGMMSSNRVASRYIPDVPGKTTGRQMKVLLYTTTAGLLLLASCAPNVEQLLAEGGIAMKQERSSSVLWNTTPVLPKPTGLWQIAD